MENRRRARIALPSICLLLPIGCATLPEHARQRLLEGDRLYREKNYAAAEVTANVFLKEFPDRPESAEAYYLRALCRIQMGQRITAEGDLDRCLSLSRRDDLTARARAALGGLAFDSGRFTDAITHFGAALERMEERPPADEMHYRYGVALQREGRWDEARKQFSALLHRFPGSRYEDDARRRFSWPLKAFSVQCGAFREAASADALVKKLRGASMDARSAAESRGGRPMHVVYVGSYASYAAADEALKRIKAQVSDAIVVP